MFGISGAEAVVLMVIAVLVLGPERLPQYAGELAKMIKELRRMAAGASAQVRQELGPEFDEVEWRKLDPRQYDPRRIVREALSDSIDLNDPLGLRDLPGDSLRGSGQNDPYRAEDDRRDGYLAEDGSDPYGLGKTSLPATGTGSTETGSAGTGGAGTGPGRATEEGTSGSTGAFDPDTT